MWRDGVCVRIQNLSDHQIEGFTIAGVNQGSIQSGGEINRQSIPVLHSHNNETSLRADDVSFRTGWIVFGIGFDVYASGAFTIDLIITDFDLGYFSIELIRED